MGVDSGSVIPNGERRQAAHFFRFSGQREKTLMITGTPQYGFPSPGVDFDRKWFDLASLLGDDFSSLLKVQTGEQEGDAGAMN